MSNSWEPRCGRCTRRTATTGRPSCGWMASGTTAPPASSTSSTALAAGTGLPRGKPVPAANAVEDVELAGGAVVPLAIQPQDGRPVVAVRRVHLPQRGSHEFDIRKLFDRPVDHREKGVGIELRLG